MSDVYYVRFWVKESVISLGYRTALKCQEAHERARQVRDDYLQPGSDKLPYFEGVDDFGNIADIDMRDCHIMMRCSGVTAAELNNNLTIAAMKQEMHKEDLIKQDPKLMAWLRLRNMQGGGGIVPPSGGMN